jgi:malate dehydrogenase (oxaloacetate-decarboxylating)(NADP+)
MEKAQMMNQLDLDALVYHRQAPAGKLAIVATKPMATQRDLALAYSPGVAAACNEIVRDPREASTVTARGNLVAVVSNGTAVLGLGAIGPLASKPVMEGKAVLFKKFSGIDVFDIEIAETDADRLVDIVAALEPTFGGINLEDIKAPECFEIERKLRERMNIPVFHDDQHGTAIVTAAAVHNGLRLVHKAIKDVKVVASGAGAAALACLDLLVSMGLPRENVTVCDRTGVIYEGRSKGMDPYKARYARKTEDRTLDDAIAGADIFLGLSGPGSMTQEMVKKMAQDPLILAMANPVPEILPELAKAVRPDAILATGRSDYPNQVNNVLCFPFIFRGALDVGATGINEQMKLACVKAIADLAMAEPSELVQKAYGSQSLRFGPEYLIPKPFDPRLIVEVSSAVAEAAMLSGVATRPIEDMSAYRRQLAQFVFRTGYLMKPIFERAKVESRRLVYAEGESRRVLQAVQQVVDEGIAKPILIGRPGIIAEKIERLSLRLEVGRNVEVIEPASYDKYEVYWREYYRLMGRHGASPATAQIRLRTLSTVIGAMMVKLGDADALIAGPVSLYRPELLHVLDVIGLKPGVTACAAMQVLILSKGIYFITDTHVTENPTEDELCATAVLAAEQVERFGITPKIAFLSSSNFGSNDFPSSVKMRNATALFKKRAPQFEAEGEMHADTALSESVRLELLPDSKLAGQANLLILPDLTSANIAYNIAKVLANGISVGPLLLGLNQPAHVMTASATVRGILNNTAIAVVEAQHRTQPSGAATLKRTA